MSANGLERMVRPFQTQDFTPPRRVLTDYSAPEQGNIKLEYGHGSGKTLTGGSSITVTLYMDTKLKEAGISAFFGSGIPQTFG